MLKTSILLTLATILFAGCGGGSSSSNCATKDACMNDQNCQCWCSVKCGWRKKTTNDSPIYIENDPNGKYCYCAQRDIDLYDENCSGEKASDANADDAKQQY